MQDVFKHIVIEKEVSKSDGTKSVQQIEYPFCFNINVIEKIHEEYKVVKEDGSETDGFNVWSNIISPKGAAEMTPGSIAKHLKFMMRLAINEGIEMEKDPQCEYYNKDLENRPLITADQAGRIMSSMGNAKHFAMQTIIESTTTGKNAQTGQSPVMNQ